MMTREQYLLIQMAEECNEIAQRCIKAARFGLHEVQPGQYKTNARRIFEEVCDFEAVKGMLEEEGSLPHWPEEVSRLLDKKVDKVLKYLEYAKEQGQVER